MKKSLVNMFFYSSGFGKNALSKLYGLAFVVIIFYFTSCTSNQQNIVNLPLTKKEVASLRYFFNFLFFENYGAFVVFGSKPLCQISLGDPDSKSAKTAFHKWLASLSAEERAKIEAVRQKALEKSQPDLKIRRNVYKGWVVFKKLLKNFKTKNYVFRIVPLRCPDAYEITLINIAETISVLTEYYEIFKKATNMEFEPNKIVLEAQDPNSIFWDRVFSMENHLAKGLLFGFGLKNSLLGAENFSHLPKQQTSVNAQLSRAYESSIEPIEYGKRSAANFQIPLFDAAFEDETAEKYRREKKVIEEINKNKDMIEAIFQRLADQ